MTAGLDVDVLRGPCCVCGREAELPSLAMLHVRGPASAAGKGWGCLVCGLPPEGAMAAICATCPPDGPIGWVCAGYPSDPGRVPLAALTEPFDHLAASHAADQADDPERWELDDDDDLPGDTDRCRYVEPSWPRREADEDLHKCGGCYRFFVQHVPLVLFVGQADDVLNIEICERCMPKAMRRLSLADR